MILYARLTLCRVIWYVKYQYFFLKKKSFALLSTALCVQPECAHTCTRSTHTLIHRHSQSYTCSEAVGSEFSICQHDHLVYLHITAFSITIWRNGNHGAKIKLKCTWIGVSLSLLKWNNTWHIRAKLAECK